MAVIVCGSVEGVLDRLPRGSAQLAIADPPYHRVLDEEWDRRHASDERFLEWLGSVTGRMADALAPNGSAFVFCSPRMAARVEVMMRERWRILNRIIWVKPETRSGQSSREAARAWHPADCEEIIFAAPFPAGPTPAEQKHRDYHRACEKARDRVMEPLQRYFAAELERSGLTVSDVAEAWRIRQGSERKTSMAGHWFLAVQWELPTRENYEWLRTVLDGHLRREYEDLRREYEDLRREYEDLRRPFSLPSAAPKGTVWTYPAPRIRGRHPAEKPLPMLLDMVETCSRPGDLVLDLFAGSGTTSVAAADLGRRYLAVEESAEHCSTIARRLEDHAARHNGNHARRAIHIPPGPLFTGAGNGKATENEVML